MRRSNREKYADQKKDKTQVQTMDVEGMLKMMLDEEGRPPERRMINPTQAAVISSPSFVNFYKGPAGCAKTSTGVAAVVMRMLMEPGSKGLIGRQDFNDLKGTTLLRATSMLERLPEGTLIDRDKASPTIWYIKPIPYKRKDGTWDDRPSELRFMGLKEALGSYDFNVAFFDEADEIERSALNQVMHRMRTKSAAFYRDLPDKPTPDDPYAKDVTGYYGIYLAFNPPEKTHWLYRAATGRDHQERKVDEKIEDSRLFEPNPKENVQNLPPEYYEKLRKNLPPDQVQRYVDGEWGSTHPGTPAIRSFRKSTHAVFELEFEPEATLYRFWDFGYRHPFCIWAQAKYEGNLFLLREQMGTDIEITAFARFIKRQTNQHFPFAQKIVDIGDIAVKQKKDTGSTLYKLYKEGIKMMFQSQSIDRGLSLLRKQFGELIEGLPAIQIDKRYCPILVSALGGGYHMDETGAEPVKDGYYDHPVDTLRYGVVGVLEPMNLKTEAPPLSSIEYDPKQDII